MLAEQAEEVLPAEVVDALVVVEPRVPGFRPLGTAEVIRDGADGIVKRILLCLLYTSDAADE